MMLKKTYIIKLSITRDEIDNYINKTVNEPETNGNQMNFTCIKNMMLEQESTISDTSYHFAWSDPNVAFDDSSIHCWNCHYTFPKNESIGIPEEYQNGSFHCYGNFCSFECAARYLYEHKYSKESHYWDELSLLNSLYQKVYNLKSTDRIIMAPPKETLECFGGSVSYDDYRHCNANNKIIQFYQLPLCPVKVYIKNFTNNDFI